MESLIQKTRQKLEAWSTKLATGKKTAPIVAAALIAAPTLSYAQVSVQKPAQAILQIVSLGFGTISALAIVFCAVAGAFGMAQWTRLLNIIGWIVMGGGGLTIATYVASLNV